MNVSNRLQSIYLVIVIVIVIEYNAILLNPDLVLCMHIIMSMKKYYPIRRRYIVVTSKYPPHNGAVYQTMGWTK